MNRRAFLTGMISTASGLVLPYEPKRIYSFPSKEFLAQGRPVLVTTSDPKLFPQNEMELWVNGRKVGAIKNANGNFVTERIYERVKTIEFNTPEIPGVVRVAFGGFDMRQKDG